MNINLYMVKILIQIIQIQERKRIQIKLVQYLELYYIE